MLIHLSTGKRRYGHPALNGVLPEPWLPLKKGQTLVNNESAAQQRNSKDASTNGGQAVVLTLRKRPSVRRPLASASFASGGSATAGLDGQGNPWQDDGATRSAQRVSHRLSFDPASGVIMLPDDDGADGWMAGGGDAPGDEDEVDSEEETQESDEEDYGVETLRRTQTEPLLSTSPATPSRASRYGTYFHHPERRRQVIPGAFPRS